MAATLTFIVYCLSEHPTVLARLRSEILTKIGASRRPDYDHIREVKYLRAVISGIMYVPLCLRTHLNIYLWGRKETLWPFPIVYVTKMYGQVSLTFSLLL